ncbi:MAG TPA: nitrous oxide reductase family maturation protein NosD [Candidatus Eisenbacteria bacterium]|nr:nitrous oxide reductase family maturation protein NosD [Candidatus Eisenbacteria bacterium]
MKRVCVLMAAVLVAWHEPAAARTWHASPGGERATLGEAAAGDTVVLARGTYRGPLVLQRTITLAGEPGAVIDGGGTGTPLTVQADGSRVSDLTIRGSGKNAMNVDAGLHVQLAHGVVLSRLTLVDVMYGIYGERADGMAIEGCRLTGRVTPGDEMGQGNGIHLWYTKNVTARRDTVERFLDGIYLSFADGTHIEATDVEHCGRYGLHTMYCPGGRLVGCRMSHNVAGCAIMFSNHLTLADNDFSHNRGPRTYGVLLRDCSDGELIGNRLVDNTIAIFMDNSNRNRIASNLFQDDGWGVLLFSSCAGNQFTGNAFLNDDYPVALDMRYSDNRFDDGHRGNYWSDGEAYDLNNDGVGDAAYSPVSAFAFLSKQYPDLAILAKSPAVAALSVSERVLPVLRPSEIVDRFPLVRPTGAAAATKAAIGEARSRPSWKAATAFALVSLGALGALVSAGRTWS